MNESIDIILKCKYYLGFDSGLFHIASALGIKTFGIFTKAHEFSHSHWDNVTIFTGNENNSLNNEYWGNPVLNNISIDNIKKTL